jgi:hypothetical protein
MSSDMFFLGNLIIRRGPCIFGAQNDPMIGMRRLEMANLVPTFQPYLFGDTSPMKKWACFSLELEMTGGFLGQLLRFGTDMMSISD